MAGIAGFGKNVVALLRVLTAWDLSPQKDELNLLVRSHASALADEVAASRAAGLEVVLAAAQESPFRLQALWARLDLGHALADAGDERAVAELEHALADAETLGAWTVKELAESALRDRRSVLVSRSADDAKALDQRVR